MTDHIDAALAMPRQSTRTDARPTIPHADHGYSGTGWRCARGHEFFAPSGESVTDADCPFCLSAAPQSTAVDMMPLVASVAPDPLEGSRQAPSWELQTPNLRERLDQAITKARDTISPIDLREWLDETYLLCERLVDRFTVCACGVAYNVQTGRCEACDEDERRVQDRRTHIGMTGRQRDAGVPF